MAPSAPASTARSWEIITIVFLDDADPLLELELGRDVEEVVGLVEQQHVGVGREEHVEHELLALAAREGTGGPLGDLVE